MALDLREYLVKLLQKNIMLKQGAVKLLNTPSINQSARYQAQQEFQDAQEQLILIEKQLELLDRLPNSLKKVDTYPGMDSAQNSTTASPSKTITTEIPGSNDPSPSPQSQLDTLVETLRHSTLPRRQVDTTNQICEILGTNTSKNLKYPSMSVLIPIIWPLLMSKHKPVNACGYKLLRYFLTSYDDVIMVFYLYHKYHHHDRYYYFPYNDYSQINDSQHISDGSDLLDLYNMSDPYKPESQYDNQNTNDKSKLKDILVKPINSKLTLPQVSDNTVKKWWPLVFLIVKTMVEDKGVDVTECIKFMRKVIELKGINFLGPLCVRVSVALTESVIASVALKLSNFQNLTPSTMELIELTINLVECLCEFTVANSKLAYDTKVIKFLIQILIDPPFTLSNHQLTNIANASASSTSKIAATIALLNTAIKNISTIPLPVIVGLLKIPNTRKYLVNSGFLPLLLSALLDPPVSSVANNTISPVHGQLNSPKLQHLASILSIIMCTWSGLGLFLENDARYLRVLMNGLYAEQVNVRTVVMSVIAGGLRIRKLTALTGNHESYELWDWERAFVAASGISKRDDKENCPGYSNSLNSLKDFTLADIRTKLGGRCCPEYEDNVVNQFTAVFLQSCVQCGLIDILKTLFNNFENDKRATRWIALLLSEVLYLKSKIIPNQINFDFTINFKLNRLIERESRKHAKLNQKIKDEISVSNNQLIRKSEIAANSSELAIVSIFLKTTTVSSLHPLIDLPTSSAPLLDQVTLSNILRDLKKIPDEVDIKPLIIQTHLPATKEYREWNWALISILVRSILWNDFKFEETLRTTKFFKRLISFYKPQKAGFVQVLYLSNGPVPGFTDRRQPLDVEFFLNRGKESKEKDKKVNRKQSEKLAETYVDVGIALIQLLLSKPDGVEILKASGIIQTISTSLLRISGVFVNDLDESKNGEGDGTASGGNPPDSAGSGRNFGFSLDHHDTISLFSTNEPVENANMGGSSVSTSLGSSMNTTTSPTTNMNAPIGGFVGSLDGDNDTIMDNDIIKMKKEGLFGPTRLLSTLAWGYIRFVGVLSSHPVGIMLMEEYGVIDALFRLIQTYRDTSVGLKSDGKTVDMVRFIIREIDFKISGQLRLLMEKVATIGEEGVRIEVTERIIGELVSLKKIGDNNDYTIERWCVGMLVRQSYDFSLHVSQLAIKGLMKYVEDERSVDILLSFNPDLGDINTNLNVGIGSKMYGGVLLWKVLGYERGVEYVSARSGGLIEQIVEGWADSRREWVNKLETLTYKKMRGIVIENEENLDKYDYFELFQRLVMTEKGVECIVNSGIIQHFVRVILIYCRFLKMGIEKELYGLGERKRKGSVDDEDDDDDEDEEPKKVRKSFNGGKKPRGLISNVSVDPKIPVWYDSSDESEIHQEGSVLDQDDYDYEKAIDAEIRGLRGEKEEGEDGEEGSDSDGVSDSDSSSDDKNEKESKKYLRKWEDKWLNDESDSVGLIEETKCSIWALGYLGQTDSGVFAIENVLEGIIEEKKNRRRNRGKHEGVFVFGGGEEVGGGENKYQYDDYSDDDYFEEEVGGSGGDDVGSLSDSGVDPNENRSHGGSEDDKDDDKDSKPESTRDNTVFSDNKDMIENFIEIYKKSINWELRGSCIIALGKISECEMGCEVLEESRIECIRGEEATLEVRRPIKVSLTKEGLVGGSGGCSGSGTGSITGVGEVGSDEGDEDGENGPSVEEIIRGVLHMELPEQATNTSSTTSTTTKSNNTEKDSESVGKGKDVGVAESDTAADNTPIDAALERWLVELYSGLSMLVVNQGRGLSIVQRLLKGKGRRLGVAVQPAESRAAVQLTLASLAAGLVGVKSGVLRFLLAELRAEKR